MNKQSPKIIAAAVIKKGSEYLLIKETLASGNDYWILPGGKVEFGESLEEAVVREIKEETNLDIKVIKFLAFNQAIFPDYNYHTVIFFFLCKPQNDEIKLEPVIKEAKYFKRSELKNLDLVDSARWLFKNYKF